MQLFRMTFLGRFIVSLSGKDDSEAQFETDTARLLLAYLAINAGTSFRREFLADLLWPDLSGPDGLHALRQTLTRLRKAFGDGDEQDQTPFLNISRQTIEFKANSDVWIDAQVFQEIIRQTQLHPHKRIERCESCLSKLREAARLYQGDLLKGIHHNSQPFEDWLTVQRERLHRQALNVFNLLARAGEQRGDYATALNFARLQVELEPWHEAAHRQMMRVLVFNGERGAALKQYEICCNILEDELGAEPEDETEYLYAQIRAGKLTPAVRGRRNLPAYLTAFVGRQNELGAITERLNHPDCRLLTLLGPGGIGKTRLSVRAAEEMLPNYHDGVFFVSLAGIQCVDQLVPAVAQVLQIQFTPTTSPAAQLSGFLHNREILLVLDGFEHLTGGAGVLAGWLHVARDLSILVTSRERLNVAGEWVLPVAGMAFSEAASGSESQDAVRLFLECARRVSPDFQAVQSELTIIQEICRATEGVPLAIELAAGLTPAYSVGEISAEIQRDLDFLVTDMQGMSSQHRSLRAVFEASWSRLSPDEQHILLLLSIFPGSFDPRAAGQIVGVTPDTLAHLAHRSLLRLETLPRELPGSKRFQMHEIIRRYTAERGGDLTWVQMQFARYFLEFLIQQRAELDSRRQPVALELIEDEMQSLKAAWKLAVQFAQTTGPGQARTGLLDLILQAGGILFTFLDERCRYPEGIELFGLVSEIGEEEEKDRIRARFMACRAWFASRLGQHAEGQQGLQLSLSVCQQQGLREELAFVLERLSAAALLRGDYDAAQSHCQESLELYKQLEKPRGVAVTLAILAQISYSMGQYKLSQKWCRQALEVVKQEGGPYLIEANCSRQLGNVAYSTNQYGEAIASYEQALERYRALGNRWGESATINNLGSIAVRMGQYDKAFECFETGLRIKDEIGDQWGVANALCNLGAMEDDAGNYEDALHYYRKALALCRDLASRDREGRTMHNMASTYMHMGRFQEARAAIEESLGIRREIGDREGESRSLDVLSQLYGYMGEAEQSLHYARQALELSRELGHRALQAYALHNLGNALAMQGQCAEALKHYQQALSLRREMGEPHLSIETLASIGGLYDRCGDPGSALAAVEEVCAFLKDHSVNSMEDPFSMYLACIRVLQARGDARAAALRRRALAELEERAGRLFNKSGQQVYLHSIPSHQALLG